MHFTVSSTTSWPTRGAGPLADLSLLSSFAAESLCTAAALHNLAHGLVARTRQSHTPGR